MYGFDKPSDMRVKTRLIGLRGGILVLRSAKYRRLARCMREVLGVEVIDLPV